MEKSLNNQITCIYSKVDNNLFLDRTSTDSVILYKKNRAINQKWYIVYNANKQAYKIVSQQDKTMALTLDFPGLTISTKKDNNLDEQHWIINSDLDSGTFTISNYKNPNLFLSIDSTKSLVINTTSTSNNNKFIIEDARISDFNNTTVNIWNTLDDKYLSYKAQEGKYAFFWKKEPIGDPVKQSWKIDYTDIANKKVNIWTSSKDNYLSYKSQESKYAFIWKKEPTGDPVKQEWKIEIL